MKTTVMTFEQYNMYKNNEITLKQIRKTNYHNKIKIDYKIIISCITILIIIYIPTMITPILITQEVIKLANAKI